MRKYKKALKEIRDQLNYISALRIDMIYLEDQLKQAVNMVGRVIKKTEFDREILRITNWLTDVESKVSMQWYTHTGLYQKIRREIADQITKNMNDILELKGRVEDERLADR